MEALAELAGQALAWRDTIADRVNSLEEIRYVAHGSGAEQLRSEVALLERAMSHCAQVLVAVARLDVDSRLAAISEAQADAVVRAIDSALAAAGISGDAANAARRVAARELASVLAAAYNDYTRDIGPSAGVRPGRPGRRRGRC